jgi:polyvinyl alcohol dehydrogenase (cytochrome)
MKPIGKSLLPAMALSVLSTPVWCAGDASQPGGGLDGRALFAQHCAVCHDSGQARIPTRAQLQTLSRARILSTLENGVMMAQGSQRTAPERAAIATFLSGQTSNQALPPPAASAMCSGPAPRIDLDAPQWNGWGASQTNHRNQDRRNAGLDAARLPRLKVKWAFGFPKASSAATQPVIVGDWVFVGSTVGRVYALDLRSGCIRWTFDAEQTVRSAPIIAHGNQHNGADYVAYFTDRGRYLYKLNAATGKLIWKTAVGTATSRSGATPKLYQDRLYVPLTSGGGAGGADPLNGCCKGRGAVTAVDAKTGKTLWYTSTVRERLLPFTRSSTGAQLWGPSGASVWSSPTIDEQRHRLYVGTGNSDSSPAAATSDSVIAMDLDTGKILWYQQATTNDAYNSACDQPGKQDCPVEDGPDFDFGQPPILVKVGRHQRLLVAAAKSGIVHAYDPDDGGREVWNLRVGVGGVLGGAHFGSAVDDKNMYVPVSDYLDIVLRDAKLNPQAGGLVAIRLTDGKQLWRTNARTGCEHQTGHCSHAQSAPPTVIPGAILSGAFDGVMRAYATDTGKVIWEFDTKRDFQTVNGVPARGGSIDVGGPAVAGGVVLTTAGYRQWQELPGNVLLAFSVDGR